MKHSWVAAGLLAAGFVLTRASSSSAAAEHLQMKGEIAELNLFQQDEISCDDGTSGLLDTALTIELSRDGVHGTRGNSSGSSVLLFFSQVSTCTGQTRDVVVVDEPAEYAQNGVHSASFADSFELVDEFTGELIGTLSFDVQLTGFGETEHDHRHSTTSSGDFVFHSHFNGKFRQASASGTVNLDGVELIDSGPFATLSELESGSVTVTH
jgi:hypothetical protein